MRGLHRRVESFRSKLILMLLATVGIALAVAGTAMVLHEARDARQALRQEAHHEARVSALSVASAVLFDDADAATQTLAMLENEPTVRAAVVYRGKSVFATYVRSDVEPSEADLLRRDGPATTGSEELITVHAPVAVDGEEIGAVVVQLDTRRIQQQVMRGLRTMAFVLLSALAVSLVVGGRLAHAVLVPIERLVKAARHIQHTGDYGRRVRPAGSDEIAGLMRDFNSMLTEIERRGEALRRQRDRLEETVAERTALLVRQNAELEAARDRAEESARFKAQFLANTSHEIRTPMNGILGMTELALAAERFEEQREYVAEVRRAAESLMRIIDDILDISKFEAGHMQLESVPFSLSETLSEALRMVAVTARQRGLELVTDLADEDAGMLIGDPARLNQILLNLLGNAVKFTEKGEVRLTVRSSETRSGARLVRIEVSDTGIGIEPEALTYIFDAFRQADGSITRRHGGTGLGLAITRELVEAMGGEIVVDSRPGRGTTFTVTLTLPWEAATESASGTVVGSRLPAPDDSEGLDRAHPLELLLAEDNPVNQRVAARLLEKLGHRVTLVADGSQALESWRRTSFDAIFMDMQMPVMDGLEATRRIRALEGEGDRVPIIALTANAMQHHRHECLEAGMDGYVAKPVRSADLAAALAGIGEPLRPEPRSVPS